VGILDLFNKQKRDLWLAKADNEQCLKERRTLLNSFRSNAISELSFKHPDALFLSNPLHAKFMVHSASAGQILLGQYADYYAPFLEFVAHAANLPQWLGANADFRKQLATRDGVVRADTREKFKALRSFYREDFVEGFKRRGFAVTSSFEACWLFGGAVFLNGEQIARSTVWSPKPPGYFAEQIYKHVIQTRHRTPTGFSNLVLKMSKCHTNYGPSQYHYEMHFGNGDNFSDTVRPSASLKNIMELRNFLSVIERDFANPNVDGEEKRIFIPDDYRELDSPAAPPHDPTIESDYPF
jgi:hypothetical protein